MGIPRSHVLVQIDLNPLDVVELKLKFWVENSEVLFERFQNGGL